MADGRSCKASGKAGRMDNTIIINMIDKRHLSVNFTREASSLPYSSSLLPFGTPLSALRACRMQGTGQGMYSTKASMAS